jgi:glycosyltransferase involved in cell wall biosynthesis
MKRICLVTEELAEAGRSGGIGAAFKEMALFLSGKGYLVDIIFCTPSALSADEVEVATRFYASHGVKLEMLDLMRYVDTGDRTRAVSYAVYQTLKGKNCTYDFVHFHDYKGIGFFSCEAKRQCIFFEDTTLVVQLHGPTRWALEANAAFFTHEDQLAIDFMERESIRWADQVVSPSAYMATWVKNNFFSEGHAPEISVIKNLCRYLVTELRDISVSDKPGGPVSRNARHLIVFARHEERKGIVQVCDALDLIGEDLAQQGVRVTFLGQPGFIAGQPSAIYFIERSKNWPFRFDFRFGLSRTEAARFLRSAKAPLVVVPSPHENSPYTVLETLVLGLPMLASLDGGGVELVRESDREKVLCSMEGPGLAAAIGRILTDGLTVAKPAESIEEVERAWLSFHQDRRRPDRKLTALEKQPLVTVGITHYERPVKVIDAVMSILRQTYQNLEVIVVDDGSTESGTLKTLQYLEVILNRVGGRLIRQKNAYLGAARNSVLRAAKGDYVVFLDDDDLATPQMVETLVKSALHSEADVVTCLNAYMPESHRQDFLSGIVRRELKVSYFPLGGPLSLAPEQNVFGSATGLLRRTRVEAIGGYSELKDVGHEDYELYLRLLQDGAKFTVCPEPLFYYEVGRPSMISRTSMMRNFRRCFDAILFARNTPAWQDYMNLCVGRPCSVNTHNRAYYLNSQASTSSLRLPLMNAGISLDEYVHTAAKLALAEGNKQAAAALAYALPPRHDAAAQVDRESEITLDQYLEQDQPRTRVAGTKIPNQDLSGIRFDIALGRVEDALKALQAYIETHISVSSDIFVVLAELTNLHISPADQQIGERLSKQLALCNMARPSDTQMLTLLKFFLHFRVHDKWVQVLATVIKADESEYLDRYPDIREEVGSGKISALEHFAWHGRGEGRHGFNRCQDAAKVIGSIIGKTVGIEHLQELSGALVSGQEAKLWGRMSPLEAAE